MMMTNNGLGSFENILSSSYTSRTDWLLIFSTKAIGPSLCLRSPTIAERNYNVTPAKSWVLGVIEMRLLPHLTIAVLITVNARFKEVCRATVFCVFLEIE